MHLLTELAPCVRSRNPLPSRGRQRSNAPCSGKPKNKQQKRCTSRQQMWDLKHKGRSKEEKRRIIQIKLENCLDVVNSMTKNVLEIGSMVLTGTPAEGCLEAEEGATIFKKKSCRNPMEPNSSLMNMWCIHIHDLSSPWLLQERCFQARCDLIRVRCSIFLVPLKSPVLWEVL